MDSFEKRIACQGLVLTYDYSEKSFEKGIILSDRG